MLLRPTGYCVRCGSPAYHVDRRCQQRDPAGIACGRMPGLTYTNDWKMCPRCGAEDYLDGALCLSCHGHGWLFVNAARYGTA
jgi:hypothetical protein